MKLSKLKQILYDARFIRSIEIINDFSPWRAIYMIRLYTGFGLALAKKYLSKIKIFKTKMKNPLQY